jgi:hypothetical protein
VLGAQGLVRVRDGLHRARALEVRPERSDEPLEVIPRGDEREFGSTVVRRSETRLEAAQTVDPGEGRIDRIAEVREDAITLPGCDSAAEHAQDHGWCLPLPR